MNDDDQLAALWGEFRDSLASIAEALGRSAGPLRTPAAAPRSVAPAQGEDLALPALARAVEHRWADGA